MNSPTNHVYPRIIGFLLLVLVGVSLAMEGHTQSPELSQIPASMEPIFEDEWLGDVIGPVLIPCTDGMYAWYEVNGFDLIECDWDLGEVQAAKEHWHVYQILNR